MQYFAVLWGQYIAKSVCVFDLLGKSGESYKMMEEWALVAKECADITLIPFQDEGLVDRRLREGNVTPLI